LKTRWIVVAVLALGMGILLVQYLTVHPLLMSLYLILTLGVLAALLLVLVRWFRSRARWVASAFALFCFVAGYWFMTARFLAREDTRELPALLRTPGDPGRGTTAVVYMTHGEPPTYDPIGWINQFREFDEQGIAFVPYPVRPLFAFALRQKYLKVGRSDHRSMHQQMINSLERAYRARGDSMSKFYLSFLDDEPRPDAAVIRALNDGASRVIISEVFLTISNHTAEGEKLIRQLRIEERLGVPVLFTGPLWDSEPLKDMFVRRANANLGGTDKSRVGVLLVGHGQPKEWDAQWPTETAQELGFREDVLAGLERDGFRRDNLGLAWMEFREPKIIPAVEHLGQKGVQRLLYFSAAISADAIHSQYDTPELVGEARLPAGVVTVNLGAWNDDPQVIQAIKDKIDTVRRQQGWSR
jgi:sirohydrochlorin ferrochelatase